MSFVTESTVFDKTVLSDLQGAWMSFRDAIVENFGFADSQRLLVQVDEAMSWESVRDLNYMSNVLLVIQNIIAQTDAPEEVKFWCQDVRSTLDRALEIVNCQV